jgi:hypothetical protein
MKSAIRLAVMLLICSGFLTLNSCSGCHFFGPSQPTEQPMTTPEAPVGEPLDSDNPPGMEEGGEMGPTDEIETPEERTLDPSTEPDINDSGSSTNTDTE